MGPSTGSARPMAAVIGLWLTLVLGCTPYSPDPLLDSDFHAVASEREKVDAEHGSAELSLTKAAEWLRRRGPRVREALARYRTALARAGVRSAWPNPGISLGPQFGFGPNVDINKVAPFVNLGVTIPLSGRLAKQDDVNAAVAEAARVDALATFRELYLELRARYLRLAIAREREVVRAGVLKGAAASMAAADDLVVAGTATALDVSLFQLEHARERSRMLGAKLATSNAAADLSDLVAVSAARLGVLPEAALPSLPEKVPPAQGLRDLIVREHPRLFRIRAEYEVAERQLHLEVTKQYPDLSFGPSFGVETGERKAMFGLAFGVELPLFDRNQQAVAEAIKRREEVRTKYESEANRILTAVERARATVALVSAQSQIIREQVLPAARANVEIARKSLTAGSATAIQLLDAERSLRQVQLEAVAARLAEQLAWSDLEKAVGHPLVEFQADSRGGAGAPPRDLTDKRQGDGL
ncbi:MAG: hypothetical protein CMJ85_11145 [Planctomycetes bacterium]|nr:hypothetical protein [Planctomycetota bacterium]